MRVRLDGIEVQHEEWCGNCACVIPGYLDLGVRIGFRKFAYSMVSGSPESTLLLITNSSSRWGATATAIVCCRASWLFRGVVVSGGVLDADLCASVCVSVHAYEDFYLHECVTRTHPHMNMYTHIYIHTTVQFINSLTRTHPHPHKTLSYTHIHKGACK